MVNGDCPTLLGEDLAARRTDALRPSCHYRDRPIGLDVPGAAGGSGRAYETRAPRSHTRRRGAPTQEGRDAW